MGCFCNTIVFLVQPDGIVAWNSAVDKLGWDAKEGDTFAITNEDRRVKLNEAIEVITLLNGGEQ